MENFTDFFDEKTQTFMFEPNSQQFWEKALEHKKSKTILTGKVTAINYNGLIVDYFGLKAFMPTKNISIEKVNSFEKYLNNDIDFIIKTLDVVNSKIIISHKDIELINLENLRKQRIANISVGHIYTGIVTSIKDFGAFVEIDKDINGLLHISQISHTKIKSPTAVLHQGQEIKVKVIKNENDKISLSMKVLEKAPANNNEDDNNEETEYKKFMSDNEDAKTSLSDLLDNFIIE